MNTEKRIQALIAKQAVVENARAKREADDAKRENDIEAMRIKVEQAWVPLKGVLISMIGRMNTEMPGRRSATFCCPGEKRTPRSYRHAFDSIRKISCGFNLRQMFRAGESFGRGRCANGQPEHNAS